MAKKNPNSKIIQGGINITGNVKIKNSKIAGRDNVEKENINIHFSFDPVYHALNENTLIGPDTKKSLEENVKLIEQEVKKGNAANANFIQQRLENIQEMAPDIAEVVIATLQNPAAGISLAVKKVINRFNAKSN